MSVPFAQFAGRFDLEAFVEALAAAASAGAGGGAHDVLPSRQRRDEAWHAGADEDLDEVAHGRGAAMVVVFGAVRCGRAGHTGGHRTTRLGVLANPFARRVRLVRARPTTVAR